MGIYPTDDFKHLPGGLIERTYNDFSGKVVTTWYQPILEIEVRETCYCCSCGEREGSDPYCRNHGYGFGERHCEAHNIGDGIGYHPDTDEQFPLESVQWHRFEYRWNEQRWEPPIDHRCMGQSIKDRCGTDEPHSHWPKIERENG